MGLLTVVLTPACRMVSFAHLPKRIFENGRRTAPYSVLGGREQTSGGGGTDAQQDVDSVGVRLLDALSLSLSSLLSLLWRLVTFLKTSYRVAFAEVRQHP